MGSAIRKPTSVSMANIANLPTPAPDSGADGVCARHAREEAAV